MAVADVEDEYQKRLANIAINQCCCLVYTVSNYVSCGRLKLAANLKADNYKISNANLHTLNIFMYIVYVCPLNVCRAQSVVRAPQL